jgi:cobalt-zinc-cadmium efflux system outer membrane protein
MRFFRSFFLKFGPPALAAAAVALAGCGGHNRATVRPQDPIEGPILRGNATHPPQPAPRDGAASVAFPASGEPITLPQLIDVALARHPELAAARAEVEAARGRFVQAGLYPNPTVGWEADELGARGRGAAAGEQGPFISQEIVTGNKLGLAQASASFGIVASDWNAIGRRFTVIARVRNAYYDLVAAERELAVLEQLVKIAGEDTDDGLLRLAKRLAKIEGFKSEQLQAEIAFANSRMHYDTGVKRRDAARRKLAAAIGLDELPDCVLMPPLDDGKPAHEWNSVWPRVQRNAAELQQARARVLQAQQDVLRAEAAVHPNLHVKVHPFYTFADDQFRLMIEGGLPLPLFDRNEGNRFAAQAELARAEAEVRRVELTLAERLTDALERGQSALQQWKRYHDEIIPKAKDALATNQAQFNRAKPDEVRSLFLSLMERYKTLTEAQLAEVRAQAEVWKADSDLRSLLQEDPRP